MIEDCSIASVIPFVSHHKDIDEGPIHIIDAIHDDVGQIMIELTG